MKIQCDVCSKKEASVYCTADEAALCDECDRSIHHANKLASKHERFSLLHPSSSNFPVCDICQEKRALIFCQQDRAILCRDCEIPLHTSNEHTKKHNRFLLTGIKLSSTTMISNSNKKDDDTIIITNNNINHNEAEDPVPNYKSTQKPTSNFPEKTTTVSNSAISFVTSNSNNINNNNNNKFGLTNNNNNNNNQLMINNGGSTTSTSNISEYLIDMLPGWHFEDLIVDSASPASLAFSKGNQNFEVNEDVMSYFDDKELTSSSTHHQSENFWVPQATHLTTTTTNAGISNVFGQQNYSGIHQNYTSGLFYGTTKQQHQQQQETNNVNNTLKMKRKYMKDDDITVPQIYSSVVSNKRNRPFW